MTGLPGRAGRWVHRRVKSGGVAAARVRRAAGRRRADFAFRALIRSARHGGVATAKGNGPRD